MTSSEMSLVLFAIAVIFGAGGHFWVVINHLRHVNEALKDIETRLRQLEIDLGAVRALLHFEERRGGD